MNNFDFTQPGSLPLTQDVLDFLQAAYKESFTGIGKAIAGAGAADMCIISGCDVTGFSTSNGYVIVNGEILPFVGGLTLSTIVVLETTLPGITYGDGITRTPRKQRYATFGTGGSSIAWTPDRRILGNLIAHLNSIAGASIKGSYNVGVVPTSTSVNDWEYTITLPVTMTGTYKVVGTIVSLGTNGFEDNVFTFAVKNMTSTTFKLLLKLIYGGFPNDANIRFDYIIFKD